VATAKPRILLIGPTALDYSGQPITQRRLYLPALTLPILGALTPDYCDLRAVSETSERIPFDEHWDLVGLTGMGSGLVRAWQIADRFREQGATVVIGGIAASIADPKWSLDHADALVIGEAEEIWPRVVEDFCAGGLQRIYRMKTPPPVESIPLPRYDVLDKRRIGPWRPVQATRGCPFSCNFCSITTYFGQRYRKRPVEAVIEDVRAAKRHGTRYIAFIDDNIGVDWRYCAELWEALIPENIIWMSQCSLHIAERADMLKLAHQSGCRLLSIGIETLSSKNLDQIDKAWNRPERYVEAIGAIKRAGIDVSTEMIIGLDTDDVSTFAATFDFLNEARISVPRVHIMTPIPGTPLFARMVEEGRMISEDFSRYSGGQVVFRPRNMAPEELSGEYWALYDRLFSWSSILRRVWRNQAGLGLFMRAVVLATNLHYRSHVRRRITPGIV
jgi:radical SAM superfamily enzyme YgiQ (UPF0313 family)